MMISLVLAGMALMAAPVFTRALSLGGAGGPGGAGGYDPGTTDTFVQNNAFTTAPEFSPDSYQDSTAFDYFSPTTAASASFTNTSFNDATPFTPSYDTSSFTDTSSSDSLSSWDPSTFDVSSNSGSYGYSGGYFSAPVVLDLNGDGLNITPLSSSNMFYDMAGDGYQHRTAWAGAGDGVLVLDTQGNGQITQRNQVVFTDWDPTAKDDMQALRDVFDSNHNGMLDAGDAQFSSFKIFVSNADGTTTLQTLAQAGIVSIKRRSEGQRQPLAATGDGWRLAA